MFPNVYVEIALLGRPEGTVGAAEGLLPRVPAVVHPELGLTVSHVVTVRVGTVPAAPWPLLTRQGRHPPPSKAADISCPLLKEQQSSVCVFVSVCVLCIYLTETIWFKTIYLTETI